MHAELGHEIQRLRDAADSATAAAAAAAGVAKADAETLAELRQFYLELAKVRGTWTDMACASSIRFDWGDSSDGASPSCARTRLAERCANAELERDGARTACLAAGAREQELLQQIQQLSQGAVELERGLGARSEELRDAREAREARDARNARNARNARIARNPRMRGMRGMRGILAFSSKKRKNKIRFSSQPAGARRWCRGRAPPPPPPTVL